LAGEVWSKMNLTILARNNLVIEGLKP